MAKNLTEIIFILDRSGSMAGLEADTIGGYNSLLEKQKKESGDAIISTVLFDDRQEILHDRTDLQNVSPITEKEYYVRGAQRFWMRSGVRSIISVMYTSTQEKKTVRIRRCSSLLQTEWRIPADDTVIRK